MKKLFLVTALISLGGCSFFQGIMDWSNRNIPTYDGSRPGQQSNETYKGSRPVYDQGPITNAPPLPGQDAGPLSPNNNVYYGQSIPGSNYNYQGGTPPAQPQSYLVYPEGTAPAGQQPQPMVEEDDFPKEYQTPSREYDHEMMIPPPPI